MKNFTIENETNNITIHASVRDAEAVPNSERFGTEAALGKLAANWPAARLVEIFNSLPGATPMKKFTDRATAVGRIWKAIQSLGEALPQETGEKPEASLVAETVQEAEIEVRAIEPIAAEPAPVEAEPVASEEATVTAPAAPQTPDVAPDAPPTRTKATRTKKTPTDAPGAPREGSKTSQVIAMLKREGGTTLEEIMTAMGWQTHTTRAMLSAGGSLTKNRALIVVSEKVGEKRVYSIKA